MSGVIDALPSMKADIDESQTVAYYLEEGDEHGKSRGHQAQRVTLRNAPKVVIMDLPHQREAGEHAEDMTSKPDDGR